MEQLDIFLTTMKPLQKVVTAQDIESSLYYVHADGAEDDKLRELLIRDQDHQVSNGEADSNAPHGGINGVPKKPLPASPQLALGDRPEPPPKVYPYYQPPANGLRGSTQYGRQSAGYGPNSKYANPQSPSIRPTQDLLGPRPIHQRLRSVDSAALDAVPERQNVNLRRWSEQLTMSGPPLPTMPNIRRKEVPSSRLTKESREEPPPLPPKSNFNRNEYPANQLPRYPGASLELPKAIESDGHRFKEQNTSLTLIRRYNGLQWNVGKISNNVDSVTKCLNDMPGPQNDRQNEHLNGAMSIEISTPGYSRFQEHGPRSDQPKVLGLSQPSLNQHVLASNDGSGAQAVFRRQLQAYRDDIRPEPMHAPNSTSSISSHDSQHSFNFHRSSYQSENNLKAANPASPPSQRSKTSKTKHYMFRSPWNGICDFDVGVLGRSIRCKHTIAPATPNPRVDPRSVQVSELRFNLPSSKTFGPSPNGTPKESKRSSFFSPQHHRQTSFKNHDPQHHDNDCDTDARMDLSLGQELAGGGFAGKQAKLGKLIVESEGLKMLDLVVAANVGLWWRVYERVV